MRFYCILSIDSIKGGLLSDVLVCFWQRLVKWIATSHTAKVRGVFENLNWLPHKVPESISFFGLKKHSGNMHQMGKFCLQFNWMQRRDQVSIYNVMRVPRWDVRASWKKACGRQFKLKIVVEYSITSLSGCLFCVCSKIFENFICQMFLRYVFSNICND